MSSKISFEKFLAMLLNFYVTTEKIIFLNFFTLGMIQSGMYLSKYKINSTS